MLLADMPTTASPNFRNRQLLISGGEFSLQVWQGSSRPRLATTAPAASGPAPRVELTSPVPAAGLDTTRMLLWNQPATGLTRDSSGWLAYTPGGAPIRVSSTAGYFTAALPLDSISSCNIDQLWYAYQSHSSGFIGVEVPNAATAAGTRVCIRPVGFNALARGVLAYPSQIRWNSLLPYGVDAVAVVLQERAGHLYFGTQRVATAAGLVVTPPLEALSVAEIVRRIRRL